MVVETTDPQALDLLSAPRSLVVRLRRQIATGVGVGAAAGTRLPSLAFERGVQDLATAVWRADGARRAHVRVLHGEIHLAPSLKPTCRLGSFELSVSPPLPRSFSPVRVRFADPDVDGSMLPHLCAGSTRLRCTRQKRLRSSQTVAGTRSCRRLQW